MEERISIENRKPRKSRKPDADRKGMIGILKSKVFIAFSVLISLVLICLLVFPIYRIEDESMYPTLKKGDIVVGVPLKAKQGDIVAVRYNRFLLIRRVISGGGQKFDMNDSGHIYINTIELEEPYISSFSRGNYDIALPYDIPDDRLFIVGDNREECIDSRSSVVGTVSGDMIDSVILIRIWPLINISFLYNR